MVGTGVYLWNRNIPTSLKVIHARMVAQAGVIGGLCGAGAYSLLHEQRTTKTSVVDHNKFRETVVKKPLAPIAIVPAAPVTATADAKELKE